MKIISIIVNFFGSGFSTEKYNAIADRNVVVKFYTLPGYQILKIQNNKLRKLRKTLVYQF